MRVRVLARVLSSKFKLLTISFLLGQVAITVGLSAQISPPPSDLPSSQQVIAFLTESIEWYRQCGIERQIASDPADLIVVEDNRPRSAQILQLSFDFARADAQFSTPGASGNQKRGAIAAGSPDLALFLQLENNTDLQIRQTSQQIEVIKTKLRTADGIECRELQAALDATQTRLNVLQAGLATIRQLLEFARAFTGHGSDQLASSIDELARTVPDVTSPMASASETQTLSLPLSSKLGDSGILALSSEVTALGRKIRILNDEIHRTNELRQASDELRKPLIASLNKRMPAVAENSLQASDLAELQQQKIRLDELAAVVRGLSPAIVALDKQRVLLAAYTSHLKSWRAAVMAEDKKNWINLITRLLAAAGVIGGLVIIGAVVRRATRRHMRDSDSRHIILVIQRLVLWTTIIIVASFSFASDLTSLVTFFGLLAAGIAVALQNVIVAALGYFVLVSRRGIRIGDRLEISGVTEDVTDIGWLQFQLAEIDKGTRQKTGRLVTFSNSFVFVSPATALSRFTRDDTTSQAETATKTSPF
jgi:Mechanosensitive ion channel